ncbi:alpha-1,2-fucosyltransferase [Azospirillum doebereinerae]|uniref:Alpha-1,2-fucosyltransferase n=1 Tax=Azospirillum doebereinerae TaxID=92933 RepID=A0A3S0V5N9_9PROT|nr:alpha-1,2-fucosyltransferase [Azospirillum doebereinerae]MCG5238905.1 alpha-1,2-fucosyltransferase [Azospirillum doebereinerae]RUQ68918.1 alpha-1,2-fucosyltransferase [Azospirillum doebereinerae]
MTLDDVVQRALDAHRAGQVEQADRLYRCVLALVPCHAPVLLHRAQLCERRGAWDEAITLYGRMTRLTPGLALPATRRSLLRIRRAIGPPPAPKAPDAMTGRVAMTSLGANGRFGNQLLQYGFLRLYGETHGLRVEAPDWIGRDLFGFDDPLPGSGLRGVREDEADLVASLTGESGDIHRDADFWGYFCGPTGRWARHRDRFRDLFRWHGPVAAAAAALQARLDEVGGELVAIHLRRGDFVSDGHWIPPDGWYRDWLAALWPTLDRPRLYVASDDPATAAGFADFAPLTEPDLVPPPPGAEFLTDFLVLTRAHRLAVSNSSFSFTAAMLNDRCGGFVRPDPARGALVPFDPWDAPVLL